MAATRIWIKNPLAIFTANDLDASGGLVIEGGRITEVLSKGQQPSTACEQTFDAREHVLLPGLINTHHHFYQTLTRAWAPVVNQPLFPWLKTLYPVWARLTPEKLALASKVALAELLRGMRFARDMVVYDTVLSDAVRASVSKNWEA